MRFRKVEQLLGQEPDITVSKILKYCQCCYSYQGLGSKKWIFAKPRSPLRDSISNSIKYPTLLFVIDRTQPWNFTVLLYDTLLSCCLPITDCCYHPVNLHLSQICLYVYTYTGGEIKSIIISVQIIQLYKIIHNCIIYIMNFPIPLKYNCIHKI